MSALLTLATEIEDDLFRVDDLDNLDKGADEGADELKVLIPQIMRSN